MKFTRIIQLIIFVFLNFSCVTKTEKNKAKEKFIKIKTQSEIKKDNGRDLK